ncbi:MAG: ABC transporter substrate-binding protein [Propionibacteriaceae bacterium]|nr:ABC transporter substrate-binding protein [Propionibacteriaceae bacterium]
MKRITLGLAAAAIGMSMFVGCAGDPAPSSSAPTSSESTGPAPSSPESTGPETIRIGINYELSGGVAAYGQASVIGIEMAVDEVNAAGGINGKTVELVKYDNKSEEAEATTLATKMMTQDNILAAIGPATSSRFMATIPVANQNKIPVISGSATADAVTQGPNGVQPYAFRICFNDSFQGTAMANYASRTLNAKSAVIFKDSSSDYAKGLAENFNSTFVANGGTIVGEEAYVAKDTDFNATLTRIRGMEFDVMYLPGYYEEVGLIIKAARELGITAPILGADGFDAPELLDLAGAAALNDIYFTNHYSSLDQDPKVLAFIAAYKAKHGQDPNAFHALGYDTAMFVMDAIGRASSLTGEAVQAALAATKDFPAVTGTLSVDENHNPVKAIVVVGLKDGVESTSEKINP